jgi:hypothetical protein
MRKNVKESLIDIFPTILDAHEIALKYAKSGEIDLVMSVFTECQEAMVKIGEVIEENEGENHKTIEFLQSYCDELYEVSLVIAENASITTTNLVYRLDETTQSCGSLDVRSAINVSDMTISVQMPEYLGPKSVTLIKGAPLTGTPKRAEGEDTVFEVGGNRVYIGSSGLLLLFK